jgi:gliding motility-associated-like protein
MKLKLFLLFFIFSMVAFSQQEASNWYFGENAGIKFNLNGTVTSLTDGQLNTIEGCATISDINGNLQFYTDGITVYNRNHQIMSNGTGLFGDISSTQSATIVQKPGSTNLFYIFTLDAFFGTDGFRYSIVDMNLNAGLGNVTSNKNVLIYTPSCEKLSIVKNANGIDYWVVTHGWNSNTFLTYNLTTLGLSLIPITTNIGNSVTNSSTDNAIGYMKISPDESKLALCHYFGSVQIFDFNNSTGVLSNEKTIATGGGFFYGIEFSPNNQVLYFTKENVNLVEVFQTDLTLPSLPNSTIMIHNTQPFAFALQLGPDGKIYVAQKFKTKLSVINNPNIIGLSCNYQLDAIDLNGKFCGRGLPPFVTSFFYSPAIQLTNACVGQSNSFSINTNQSVTSATWDFGDSTGTVTGLAPTHVYNTAGTFPVTVTTTSSMGTGTNNRDIVISALPTATPPTATTNRLICNPNNDGLYTFDLTLQSSAILNGQSSSNYQVKYFANAVDYSNNTAIANPASYTNSVAYQAQTIIAEVSNIANTTCKASTNFSIQVFETPIPATNVLPIRACDNTTVGTDNDGKILFNLTQRTTTILNGQAATTFTVSFYRDAALTNLITTPATYQNTNPTETIYVKVSNIQNSSCFATTSFTIEVFSLPTVTLTATLKQCDDNLDGFSAFNLQEANALLVTNTTGLTFSFFETALEAQNNQNIIPNPTAYTNQVLSNDAVFVRIQNANGCFRIAQLNLIVSTTLIPATFQRTFTLCDDVASGNNHDGISTNFNFSSVTAQIQALYPLGQLLTITYYKNQIDALAEQNAITNTSSYANIGYQNSQNIYVRVDSQLNNECLGLGHHITLVVEKIPIVTPLIRNHCDDDQDGIFGFDTTNLQTTLLNGLTNVSVAYKDQNNNPLPSPLPNPFNTISQTISVRITNSTTSACYFDSTIQFIVNDLPEAFAIPITQTTVCDDETDPINQNGTFSFDTSTFQNTILGTQTGMTVNYFDANNNPLPSPLPNPFTTATQNIRVEVINPINTTCKAIRNIPFIVHPVPKINLIGTELICSDNPSFTKVIDAGLVDPTTSSNFTYIWYKNGILISTVTSYSLTVNSEGLYTVEVKNAQNCTRTRAITVTASNIATINNVTIRDLSDENSVEILVSGLGEYVYSLDAINYQTSNVFTNIESGIYTVYVKDLKNCGIATQDISVLGIPKFFTPNEDGFNDFWNIKGINSNFNSKTTISIFDRYGKLLKQFSTTSQGWNGKFNNEMQPADDYWFVIELADGRTSKGHFALKR